MNKESTGKSELTPNIKPKLVTFDEVSSEISLKAALRRILVELAGDSNYLKHCRRELKKWFEAPENDPDRWMAEHMEAMLALFAIEGHSGFSASFARTLFNTLSNFEPWGDLTGEEDEWREVGDGLYQNIRCGRVFKENGVAYDIDGKVFVDRDGNSFTNKDSRVNVTFPYKPTTEFVNV